MFRSLLRFPTKSRGHKDAEKDAEKELVEVMELFSKYPSYLAETEKTEFKNEYERLQREIQLYKIEKSAAKLRNADMILDDCSALKDKVAKTIRHRRLAFAREVSAPTGVVGRGHEKLNPPPAGDASATESNHSNGPSNIKIIGSLPTTSADTSATDMTRFKPQSGVPSVNPGSGLPQSYHIPVHANSTQAISQVTSGISCAVDSTQAISRVTSGMSYAVDSTQAISPRISCAVDSMIMVGTSAEYPTMNVDSPGCFGAKILSDGLQAAQQVPQPARSPRAVGRRAQQRPSRFANANISCNSSMILSGSSVVGATLNVNARNCSGAGKRFLSSRMLLS
ncbi:uncharacterized protein F5147DRAFT_315465 [Suillus discolor]|uniref:Uncharacterized protein n=1 Tax=Suillus discolor TaxID=1912936 RepID=A0A9P7JR90_9AGAM|nr:uncharacterized protein F5147DRAFT_315465 [Suillus discolor]KAG2101347.1 hypothetical protein F5147DRAFT_315465 [Suillus discolor]